MEPEHRQALWRLHCTWRSRQAEPDRLQAVLDEYGHWRLFLRSRQGDPQAARAFERYWTRAARRFASRGFEPDQVGDLTGLFFERVYRKGLDFNWEGAFTSYLKAILVNLARDELRRLWRLRRREVHLDETIDSGSRADRVPTCPSPEEHLLDKEGQEALHQVLARLKPLDRHIVLGSLVEGRSGQELARSLGLTRDAVYQRLRRAKRRLRRLLAEDERLSNLARSDRPDLSGPKSSGPRKDP